MTMFIFLKQFSIWKHDGLKKLKVKQQNFAKKHLDIKKTFFLNFVSWNCYYDEGLRGLLNNTGQKSVTYYLNGP